MVAAEWFGRLYKKRFGHAFVGALGEIALEESVESTLMRGIRLGTGAFQQFEVCIYFAS